MLVHEIYEYFDRTYLSNILCCWAIFGCCKWPNNKQIIQPSGHTALTSCIRVTSSLVTLSTPTRCKSEVIRTGWGELVIESKLPSSVTRKKIAKCLKKLPKNDLYKNCQIMWQNLANYLLSKALKSCLKFNKSPNLVTQIRTYRELLLTM